MAKTVTPEIMRALRAEIDSARANGESEEEIAKASAILDGLVVESDDIENTVSTPRNRFGFTRDVDVRIPMTSPSDATSSSGAEALTPAQMKKKQKRKSLTLTASNDPAALQAYTRNILAPQYKAETGKDGSDKEVVAWAMGKEAPSKVREGVSSVIDAIGYVPAHVAAQVGGAFYNAAAAGDAVYSGITGSERSIPFASPAALAKIPGKLDDQQEQNDLAEFAQDGYVAQPGLTDQLRGAYRTLKSDPLAFAQGVGEGTLNPRDAFWNAATIASPVKGARTVRGMSAGQAANQTVKNLTRGAAESGVAAAAQEVVAKGEGFDPSNVALQTVTDLPMTFASGFLGKPKKAKKAKSGTKEVAYTEAGSPQSQATVDPDASLRLPGAFADELAGQTAEQTAKAVAELRSRTRGKHFSDAELLNTLKDPAKRKHAEAVIDLMRRDDPEMFAELEASVKAENDKLVADGLPPVITVYDRIAEIEPDVTPATKPLTEKQKADQDRVVATAKQVHAIPKSIPDEMLAGMTDAQLRKAVQASVILKQAGDASDNIHFFENLTDAAALRAEAQKRLKVKETPVDAGVNAKANASVESAVDALRMRDFEGKTFSVDGPRAKAIVDGLKNDDGRVAKRLADDGYSASEINSLIELANNTDKNALKAFTGIIDRKPVDIAPEIDAAQSREATYRWINNKERAQAIGSELNQRDAIDAENSRLDEQARATLQSQTDNIIRSEAQRVAGEEGAAMSSAQQDLGDADYAKLEQELHDNVATAVASASVDDIKKVMYDVLLKNPEKAAFMFGDNGVAIAKGAADKRNPLAHVLQNDLKVMLDEKARAAKQMGRLPKGFM